MINPVRQGILHMLGEISEETPDTRLGQLVVNLSYIARGLAIESIWDMDDEELLDAARRHLEQWKSQRTAVA